MTQKLPTIKEIARQLGISPSAVSRALHDHPSIGAKTRLQVKRLAEELNYVPNQTALFFKEGKTKTIGVILPFLSEEFFSKAISGVEDTAMDKGYTVLVGQSKDREEREKIIVKTMANHRVDGLIISIAKDSRDVSHFEELRNYHIPIVFFDRIPLMKSIFFVRCNLRKGTEEAMEFLISAGHKRIALLNGPRSLAACGEREQGYIACLKKHHLSADHDLINYSSLEMKDTEIVIKKLLSMERPPTAILAFNDYVALDAIQCVKNLKLGINTDITILSFANISLTHYLSDHPLASVEQFPEKQGQKAVELLLDILDGNIGNHPKHYIVNSKLVLHKDDNPPLF